LDGDLVAATVYGGGAITAWTSFTPTGSFTNATYYGRWRRVGDSIELQIAMQMTGTPGAATLSFPTINNDLGLAIDWTKVAGNDVSSFKRIMPESNGRCIDAAPSSERGHVQVVIPASDSRIYPSIVTTAPNTIASGTGITEASPFTWAVGDVFVMQVAGVPIVGW
jgi:hypothetical protein